MQRSPVKHVKIWKNPQLMTLTVTLWGLLGWLGYNRQMAEAQLSPGKTPSPSAPSAPSTPPSSVPASLPARYQVSLNGTLWRAAWVQWTTRQNGQVRPVVGLSDVNLAQILGLRLLSSNDPTQQPVEWFSDGKTQPLNLKIGFDGQRRYLDISPLAEQYGWQVQPQENFLKITTPTATLDQFRVGKQANGGDRWVLSLNRPTPWQLSRRRNTLLLTIDGQPNPEALKMMQAQAASKNLKLSVTPRDMVLEFAAPLSQQPRVWMFSNPSRLVMDWQTDPLPPLDLLWTPGLRWQQETVTLGESQFPVTRVVINPKQAGLKLQPIFPDSQSLVGINPLVKTAQQGLVAAAINGGYFNRTRQMPLGAIRSQGRWLSSPILNRGAIAWDNQGAITLGRLQVQERLTTSGGQTFTLQSFNSGYVQAGIARYSPDWGLAYTPMTDNETVITVQGNQVKSQTVVATANTQVISIPRDGYVLALRSLQSAASAFPVGSSLTLTTATTPNDFERYPYALGAGPLLITQGQIVLDAKREQFSDTFIREQAPRSAIARLANGQLALIAVQHRLGGTGPTLAEWAQLLQQMGVVDALNLDGGSSTSLYLGGDLINRSSQDVARVHNGIGVFIQPPTTPITLTEPLVGFQPR